MMNTLRYTQLTQTRNAVAENTSNLLLICKLSITFSSILFTRTNAN